MDFKRAIGYLRVEDSNEVEVQKQSILLYANDNGYHIIDWRIDHTSEEERIGLDELLYGENMSDSPLNAVIVMNSKTLSNDLSLYLYCLYTFEKNGVKLLTVEEGFEDKREFIEQCRPVLSYIADKERRSVSRWTEKGKSMKAKFGGYSGGGVPYGYNVKGGQLFINKKEQPIVEFIFEQHKAGKPMLTIADELNDRGFKTKRGKKFHATTISSILKNEPTYRGMYKYGDMDWVKGVHEPILKDED